MLHDTDHTGGGVIVSTRQSPGTEGRPTRSFTEWWSRRRAFESITRDEIMIDAPPKIVWSIYTDVERWEQWTASVTSASVDPSGALQLGSTASIKQPRLPRVVWTVSELDPGRSWTWQARSPGAYTVARHTITPDADGRVHVSLSIDQRGVLGRPIGLLLTSLTRRYLRLEAEGLRRRSEACSAGDSRGPRPVPEE
jgi:uncharacterized protein YndB with AHSA1/START domain